MGQFSVSNPSVKLKYSIGLPTLSKINLLEKHDILGGNDRYYAMSLSSFTYYSSEYTIYGSAIVDSFVKIRPVIS